MDKGIDDEAHAQEKGKVMPAVLLAAISEPASRPTLRPTTTRVTNLASQLGDLQRRGWRSFATSTVFGTHATSNSDHSVELGQASTAGSNLEAPHSSFAVPEASMQGEDKVAFSSRFVAAMRALESERPAEQRLFTDEFAACLAAGAVDYLRQILNESQTKKAEMGTNETAENEGMSNSNSNYNKEEAYWDEKERPYLLIRTKFFDDYTRYAASEEVGIRQVVILGAGMDTRPLRMPWPDGTIVWEIDRPDVLQWKIERLETNLLSTGSGETFGTTPVVSSKLKLKLHKKVEEEEEEDKKIAIPNCGFHRCITYTSADPEISMDLTSETEPHNKSKTKGNEEQIMRSVHYLATDLALEGWHQLLSILGHNKEQPTLWLVEGLIYYLPQPQILMNEINAASAPDSMICIDLVNTLEKDACSFRSSVDQPEIWLHDFGWRADLVLQPGDEGANYGRFTKPFPPRSSQPDCRRAFLVQATKK
jgi:O-methyltransferase involved in polyketide biosynthesis